MEVFNVLFSINRKYYYMTVYIKRILVYVYIYAKKEEMPYCRKWNRKERRRCRLAGPQTGLGRAPGRACLVGDRPPGRPRPGSRPGVSGG